MQHERSMNAASSLPAAAHGECHLTDAEPKARKPVVIKKYANRRLYNTASSSYITLDDLARLVRDGVEFQVFDAKSGDDITRTVLNQIIFEAENTGENLLPVNFLRDLIRAYGANVQGFLPGYLEMSMKSFAEGQDQWRKALTGQLGPNAPMELFQSAVQRNMDMMAEATRALTGLARPGAAASRPSEAQKPSGDDLAELKAQLAAMQAKLDRLSG
jgi:polyhydroxyalkanoate synthesis repressor PhaR